MAKEQDRASRLWLVALLLVGLAVRLVAVWVSTGIVHPDEHQQYLEQGFRLLHGYGAIYWEQQYGMRHPLFSGLLAGFLWLGEHLGIENPHALAAVERLVTALISYGAMAYLAWTVHARGRPIAALAFAFLLACSIDLVFIQVRIMSENASIAVLALVLACWPDRAFLAGCLLGAMVGLRLQTAPLAAGFWALAIWLDMRRTPSATQRPGMTARLTAGLSVALLALGWIDYRYHGHWFHSFMASVQRQWIEGGANEFGRQAAYRYVLYGSAMMLRVSVVALPFLCRGARLRVDLAAIAILFVAAHSLVAHKEPRFLWPLVPIGCLLLSFAFEDLYERIFCRKRVDLALIIVSLLVPSLVRVWTIGWYTQPYSASCQALAWIGKQSDVHGVLLVDIPRWMSGNYFFLRKDVPIQFCSTRSHNPDRQAMWKGDDWNYVVVPRMRIAPELIQGSECMYSFGDWSVFKRAVMRIQIASIDTPPRPAIHTALCQGLGPSVLPRKQ